MFDAKTENTQKLSSKVGLQVFADCMCVVVVLFVPISVSILDR